MDKIYAVVECEGGYITSTINIKIVEEPRKSLDKYVKWMRRFRLQSRGKYTRELYFMQILACKVTCISNLIK